MIEAQSDWERKRWAVIRKGDRVRMGRMDRGRKHDVVGNDHSVKTEGLAPLHPCLKGLGGAPVVHVSGGKNRSAGQPFHLTPSSMARPGRTSGD
jgi:hypothetical protein